MTDTNLLHEVNDALRQDRMQALWQTYRMPLLAGAVAMILGSAGMSIWRNYQENRAGATTQQLLVAQTLFADKDYTTAAEKFAAIAASANSGDTHDMAQLWQARSLIKADQAEAAKPVLAALSEAPSGTNLLWRDLACLHLVGLDATQTACLKAGASPLKQQRDLLLAATLWEQGEKEPAIALLNGLLEDPATPKPLRDRAQTYRAVMK